MRKPSSSHRAGSGLVWAGIVVLALAGCGTLEALPPQPDDLSITADHAYIANVEIAVGDTRESIAAQYGGDVVVWRPEAGFAILGLPAPEADAVGTLDQSAAERAARPRPPLPASAAPNAAVFFVPPFDDASALSVNAWAGGVSAWAGGVNAWAGGVNAWAGGVDNPFPGNESYWSQMRLGEAQDLTTYRGLGVTVAIIDSGLDLNHVAFANRLAPKSSWLDLVDGDAVPHEGYVTTCLATRGRTCTQTALVPTSTGPFFGHGTAVAGVVLQSAPNVTLLPIRVLSSWGYGSATNVALAIDHAIEQGAKVINLSLGTFEPVPAITQMLAYAGQRGVVVVAASGNTANANVMYPAADAAGAEFPLAISVGSVDATDRKSWFSTYGLLETTAPGEGVRTLYPGDAVAYALGTSFSAPWVSGTVALILGDGGSASAATTEVLRRSVGIDQLNPSWAGQLGSGRLDAREAVKNAVPNKTPVLLDPVQPDLDYM